MARSSRAVAELPKRIRTERFAAAGSRELAERELRVERDELAAAPEEERVELQLIYEAKVEAQPALHARAFVRTTIRYLDLED